MINNSLHLISMNTRGLRSKKRFEIFRWLKSNKCDIALLQETFCTKEFTDEFKRGWNGQVFHSCSNSSHSRGVAILLREGLQSEVISVHNCDKGRLLLLNIKVNNKEICIVNVYAPNKPCDRIEFFSKILTFINKYACTKTSVLIGGDFNCVLNNDDRISNSCSDKKDPSTAKLKSIISTLSLCDIWKIKNPSEVQFSYIDAQPSPSCSRIDLWLGSQNLRQYISKCLITSCPAPDHKAVTLSLAINDKPRGPGYWKMNVSILNNTDYVDKVKEIINTAILQYRGLSNILVWEYLKRKIKEFSINYSVQKSKHEKNKEKQLEKDLNDLDQNQIKSKSLDNLIEKEKIKSELNEIYIRKAKAYQIRSRALKKDYTMYQNYKCSI